MSGEARRRNKKKRSKKSSSVVSKETEKQGSNSVAQKDNDHDVKVRRKKQDKEEEEEESIWKTFTSHPLIQALPWVLILFAFQAAKQGITKVTLQYPDVLNQILPLGLRSSVGVTDARQVLIVGTINSGLAHVAAELSTKLDLEVGHGNSDALSYYVRDGTASWLHVMRYLPLPTNMDLALFELCKEPPRNMESHPRMYKTSSDCSNRDEWSSCWAKACFRILQKEWGCARRDDGCENAPFVKVLHQVRNPLTIVEDLVAIFCEARNAEFESDDLLNGVLSSTFVTFNNAMFTNGKNSFSDYSCIEGASYHVIQHANAMIIARAEGLVDAVYKFEESTSCDVAELAGFGDKSTVMYEPNYATTVVKCAFELDPATDRMTFTHKHTSSDEGRVSLEWSDLQGGQHGSTRKKGDMRLVKEMKKLMVTLGYDPDEKREPASKTGAKN